MTLYKLVKLWIMAPPNPAKPFPLQVARVFLRPKLETTPRNWPFSFGRAECICVTSRPTYAVPPITQLTV